MGFVPAEKFSFTQVETNGGSPAPQVVPDEIVDLVSEPATGKLPTQERIESWGKTQVVVEELTPEGEAMNVEALRKSANEHRWLYPRISNRDYLDRLSAPDLSELLQRLKSHLENGRSNSKEHLEVFLPYLEARVEANNQIVGAIAVSGTQQ